MISKPMDVLSQYPIRKSRRQKQSFREDVSQYLEGLGYKCTVERGFGGVHNIVVGYPDAAKHVITAHYDTPAWLPFPNLITPCHLFPFVLWQVVLACILSVPAYVIGKAAGYLLDNPSYGELLFSLLLVVECAWMLFGSANQNNANDNTSGVVTLLSIASRLPLTKRDEVCFILFDLEEAGMIGSSNHASIYKEVIKGQIVFNLDCVGAGDNIVFFPTNKLRKDEGRMKWLSQCNGFLGNKSITLRDNGFSYYPSDQMCFPLGVGIAALKEAKNGWLYCDKIHTSHDTVLDEYNVEIISECLINMMMNDDILPSPPFVNMSRNRKKPINNFIIFVILTVVSCVLSMLIGAGLALLSS